MIGAYCACAVGHGRAGALPHNHEQLLPGSSRHYRTSTADVLMLLTWCHLLGSALQALCLSLFSGGLRRDRPGELQQCEAVAQ